MNQPETTFEPASPPFGPTTARLVHLVGPLVAYGALLVALGLATTLVTTIAANQLPGVIPFGDQRVVLIGGSCMIALTLVLAFQVGGIEHGLRGAVPELARRARYMVEVLGLRRSPRQALMAILLGLAGGALDYGLTELVLLTVAFPPIGPDARGLAIAGAAPLTGAVYFALYAPLNEEILFRGMLLLAVAAVTFRWSSSRTRVTATLVLLVLISAAFGHAHLNFSAANAVTAGISGLVYGALALQQRSLWPAVIAHAAVNFALVLT